MAGLERPTNTGLLYGVLAGLAAKVSWYAVDEVAGLTASVRQAVGFLRKRGYPSKKWLRLFGIQLVRQGIPGGCLPRCLRTAISAVRTLPSVNRRALQDPGAGREAVYAGSCVGTPQEAERAGVGIVGTVGAPLRRKLKKFKGQLAGQGLRG